MNESRLVALRALALPLGLAFGLLGCLTRTVAPDAPDDPPAWQGQAFYPITRATARTAMGAAPILIVRLVSEGPPTLLLWSPIPAWVAEDGGIDALPFVPTPDQELRVPAGLAGCAEIRVFAGPIVAGPGADPLAPGQDVLLAPLPAERWAALPADPCAMGLRYGTPSDRSGTWLRILTHAGVVSEHLVVASQPAYWALVPLSAIADTSAYILFAGALFLMMLPYGLPL
jgi:hypothetical protein